MVMGICNRSFKVKKINYITIYLEDDEAYEIWTTKSGYRSKQDI